MRRKIQQRLDGDEGTVDLGQWMHRNPLFRMYTRLFEDKRSVMLYTTKNKDQGCIISLASGTKPISRDGMARLMWWDRRNIRRTV